MLSENYAEKAFSDYDSYLVFSHIRGHAMTGFGGAVKNISIWLVSDEDKSRVHSGEKQTRQTKIHSPSVVNIYLPTVNLRLHHLCCTLYHKVSVKSVTKQNDGLMTQYTIFERICRNIDKKSERCYSDTDDMIRGKFYERSGLSWLTGNLTKIQKR